MKGKERVYVVKTRLIERCEREWKNRKAVWIGLAVLFVVLLHFQILASISEIRRELNSIDYELYRMENRMALIAEQAGVARSDWDRARPLGVPRPGSW